ncbi:MAG: proline--tRNA ligase [Candidatus Nanopelagicales bacterium]|nr:proline--tRNA ligase [Candidatus Nanopelagicales bacterium]MCF8538701.1 proline--tRNA ligase [Candidatus Nanopelagicales bacterium]MCF8550820.1 proline--tRNA ligase [Candidatus Nanopelagicales bacterium]
MISRMSTMFLRTLRDDPADAEVPSHKLLVRGGYVRRIAPGIFSWLPLGYIVFRNVERIVREEMDRAGFQEVHFPSLLPREAYEETGRWTEYGDNLFRLTDRRDNDYLLGPTHEEMFTLMVKGEYSSYKDLPLVIYQIQTKFRDEARPRAGILRGREFVMKDSYSFDVTDEGLELSYQRHRDAYISTFDRMKLSYVIVSAMAGAMGGSQSEEFLASSDVGEDTYVRCDCGYAANVEAVVIPAASWDPSLDLVQDLPAAHVEATPDTPTIDTLVDISNSRPDLQRSDRKWVASDTLKNLLLMLRDADGNEKPLAIGVPGDREVDMRRLEAAIYPYVARPFDEEDFAQYPVLAKGYIGPGVLGRNSSSGIEFRTDPRVVRGTRWITGANEHGKHVYDLVFERDFVSDSVIDVAEVKEGDICHQCGGSLHMARGIEIGHIFQLGRKYADALGLKVLDEKGDLVTVTMGSYGIGVSRAVAAIAEQHHDDRGLIWPREVSPADVYVIAAGKTPEVFAAAEEFANEWDSRGLRVIYDDRTGVSPGVKFNDSELLGIPTIVVIGKGLERGVVEVKDRATGERVDVEVGHALDYVLDICTT